MTTEEKKQLILNNIQDLVTDFLWYDRKEDDDLPPEAIEDAIKEGTITIDEMVEEFKKHLTNSL
jgi:hypothetical protein